jgi:EpsI family protein
MNIQTTKLQGYFQSFSAIYYLPVILAFAFVQSSTFSWMLHNWFSYRGSHGPVILGISLYMIWSKRKEILNLNIQPNLLFGAVITILGCFMLISGIFSSILILQYISLIVTLFGVVWLIFGANYLKALWYPIGYLIFMFPIFSELLERYSIVFQNIAAWIAYNILNLSSIAVLRNANFLELPNITLNVARECNGINHITALVSLAIPLGYWTQRTWLRKSILILAAFLIGIFANGLRVAIIGFSSIYNKGGSLHGPYDLFYVSFIFFFGMAILIAISTLMMQKKSTTVRSLDAAALNLTRPSPIQLLPLITAIVIFLLTIGYLFLLKPKPVYLQRSMTEFPRIIGNWSGQDIAFTEPPFKYFSADTELKRVYKDNSGREIKLYIGYFASQDQDREIVNYRFDPLQQNAKVIRIPIGSDVIVIKNKIDNKASVYFWYDINGKALTDRYAAKAATIFDAFLHRRTNAAIVVIAADRAEKEKADIQFVKDLFPVIQTYLETKSHDET